MKLYRFSPIESKEELLNAVEFLHVACLDLCKKSLGNYLPIAGNVGIFCHYDDEFEYLTKPQEEITDKSDAMFEKYFRLHEPVVINEKDEIPGATYTHLYIRKPDPYRHHVGDVDFLLEQKEYDELKQSARAGNVQGARVFERTEPDMIELHDPDIDALGYIRPREQSK